MAEARHASVRRRTRLRAKFALAALTALVTFGAIEGSLWLFDPLPPPAERLAHRFLPGYHAMSPAPRAIGFDPGPLPGVTPGRHVLQLNRWGYFYPEDRRERRSPDELRIAVVGGSTVECSALREGNRWSAVLERLLQCERKGRPVTVLNLGLSAMDSRTHLATMAQHATSLDLDAAVFLLGANDLSRVAEGEFPLLSPDNFYEASSLARDVRSAWHRTQIGRHLDAWHERLQDAARTTPYFQAEAERQATMPELPAPLTIGEPALAGYARNIVSLAGLCREHGIIVLFTTQPTMLTATPSDAERAVLWGMNTGRERIAIANFVALLDQLNRRLVDTCTARGYPFVDLAAAMPKGLGAFYDQVHFTESGARRVAELLLPRLRELLDRRPQRR